MIFGVEMQVLVFVILGVLAAVVLFQLYARSLGRKVGRGARNRDPAGGPDGRGDRGSCGFAGWPGELAPLTGVAALRARDASFDPAQFLQGARQAYQTIVNAFTEGDRATLKPLLAPAVMDGFETAMRERLKAAAGRTETVGEFLQPPPRLTLPNVSRGR